MIIVPKKKANKAEREYMSRVAQLPCVVCGARPVEVHHKTGAGMALRADHFATMSLCVEHHRGDTGVHAGVKTFEANYGTQDELIEKTKQRLEML